MIYSFCQAVWKISHFAGSPETKKLRSLGREISTSHVILFELAPLRGREVIFDREHLTSIYWTVFERCQSFWVEFPQRQLTGLGVCRKVDNVHEWTYTDTRIDFKGILFHGYVQYSFCKENNILMHYSSFEIYVKWTGVYLGECDSKTNFKMNSVFHVSSMRRNNFCNFRPSFWCTRF